MTIDTDVHATARYFGLDPALIQAVVTAEGDILKAVRYSVPTTKDRQQALEITCRSAVHAMSDYLKQMGAAGDFVQFWGARWAPIGVANDPHNLNKNWVVNVRSIWASATPAVAKPEPHA